MILQISKVPSNCSPDGDDCPASGHHTPGIAVTAPDHLLLIALDLAPGNDFICPRKSLTFLFPGSGTALFINGEKRVGLLAGDVFLVETSGNARVRAGQKGFHAEVFAAQLEHFLPLFSGKEISGLDLLRKSLGDARLHRSGSVLAEKAFGFLEVVPAPGGIEHRSALLRLASHLLAEEFESARARKKNAPSLKQEDHIAAAFESLTTEDLLTLSVGRLAARFKCSQRHLNRLFHQRFGLSVLSLRMELRLLRALSLLRDPDAKIMAIARRCGFKQLALFNRCFKRRYGVSPSQWRKTRDAMENQDQPQYTGHANCAMHAIGLCPWSGGKTITASPGK